MEELVDRVDLANYLKISVRTVDKLLKAGLPVIRITPRIFRFKITEVLAWLRENNL